MRNWGWQGISTHSFRRSGITKLHDAGVLLRRIQAQTGHVSLGNLALYVEVNQTEVDADGELLKEVLPRFVIYATLIF